MINTRTLSTLILVIAVAVALYVNFRPHKPDPHYYAAACVVINDIGVPPGPDAFREKLNEVIANENSSYAVNKVEFDVASANDAITHYQKMRAAQKREMQQGVDRCLNVFIPDGAKK
ncbi:hypothetical protein [Erwinia tasmaniensis]|uniref:hypothetical protein n=1 Tax=Erwinia tasmaniensis TaxID=338565 RepID=UPI003A4DE701